MVGTTGSIGKLAQDRMILGFIRPENPANAATITSGFQAGEHQTHAWLVSVL